MPLPLFTSDPSPEILPLIEVVRAPSLVSVWPFVNIFHVIARLPVAAVKLWFAASARFIALDRVQHNRPHGLRRPEQRPIQRGAEPRQGLRDRQIHARRPLRPLRHLHTRGRLLRRRHGERRLQSLNIQSDGAASAILQPDFTQRLTFWPLQIGGWAFLMVFPLGIWLAGGSSAAPFFG